jgi:hypothetical protein
VDGQGVGTITNDDNAPTLAINDVTVTEGDAGTTNAVFTVSLTGGTALPATVDLPRSISPRPPGPTTPPPPAP